MTLIKSISGIRGTIGPSIGDDLTPLDAVRFASAYAKWIKSRTDAKPLVVIGRDARPSGEMISNLVSSSLLASGIDVVDLGLSTTPTVEIAVPLENANGGIILTASHNPVEWNALKLLNEKGEFISGEEGKALLEIAEKEDFDFVGVHDIGVLSKNDSYLQKHIEMILALDLVNVDAIRNAVFKIAVDGVNSSGGVAVPMLLKALGVNDIIELYCEPHGRFPHNPEPLKEHLGKIMSEIKNKGADLGIVVDPDVDRLAFISENGDMFGEEYTLVAVADYVLSKKAGNTVSNLSSTGALRDLSEKYGVKYSASAVGEVNVVNLMKESNAVIGGEGNGGVILPELHYGRDALVGIALALSLLAERGLKMSELKSSYPQYEISKNKIQLQAGMDVDAILNGVEQEFSEHEISTVDGVKINFDKEWVHLRKSNTEPIIRVYSESKDRAKADELAERVIRQVEKIAGI